jgi:hypothetical protein
MRVRPQNVALLSLPISLAAHANVYYYTYSTYVHHHIYKVVKEQNVCVCVLACALAAQGGII